MWRLGRAAAAHPVRVLLGWVLAVGLLVVVAAAWGQPPTTKLELPGSPSQEVLDQLGRRFPEQAGGRATVVFGVADGRVDTPARQRAIAATLAEVESLDQVKQVIGPVGPAAPLLTSEDGRVAWAQVLFDTDAPSVPDEVVDDFVATDGPAREAGMEVGYGGEVVEQVEPEATRTGEIIGVAVALLVLAVAFGSVGAAVLPVVLAGVTVGVGMVAIRLLSGVVDVNAAALSMASMIGVAVGIDYALFVVTRFRQSLHEGETGPEAVARSIDTAGRSVLFAGGTVMVSVLGLAVVGVPIITSLGTAVSLTVGVALAASLTLLPALLGLLGRRIDAWRVPFVGVRAEDGAASFSSRWAQRVTRRPMVALVASAGVLVALAVPFLRLETGWPDAGNRSPEDPARVAYDLMADGFGVGANAPLLVLVDQADPSRVEGVRRWLTAQDGVAAVTPALVNDAGDTALVQVTPATGPQDPRTAELVDRLRTDDRLPAGAAGSVGVTGASAFYIDLDALMAERLAVFVGAVVGLSVLLLTAVFRAPVVALKAAVMNLLGIAAAYGVVVAVFQWGWGIGLVGLEQPVPVVSTLPMVMFAVLFGLSMDYEVFILSRVRESWLRQGDNRTAVVEGLAASSRVVTAAALIMLAVFTGFVSADAIEVKMAGFGLAVAVLLDATLIRQVLVPATMTLLGERNWWIPSWLDRLLPDLDVEGGGPDETADATAADADGQGPDDGSEVADRAGPAPATVSV